VNPENWESQEGNVALLEDGSGSGGGSGDTIVWGGGGIVGGWK
jgi:hypothetical protein